jgi:hypothetical protein
MRALAAIALLGLLVAVGARAAPVYRCGSAYADTPCPQAATLDIDDARSEAQRADSLRTTAREKRLGDQMERDRLAREAARPALRPANLGGAPAPQAERPRPRKVKGWKKPKKPAKPA